MLLTESRDLIGHYAHDVRNYVGSLLSNARVLLDEPQLGGHARAAADDIVTLCDALAVAVQNLEALVPADAPPPRSVVSLRSLVLAATERVAALARLHEVEVQLEESSLGAIEVAVHRGSLELCLVNLLMNAIQYSTGRTPVQIHVESRSDHADVHVDDDGPGLLATLGPEPLSLEAQRRAQHGRLRHGRALGLLAAAASAIAGGAEVRAGDPGRGNRFTVRFRLAAPTLLPGAC